MKTDTSAKTIMDNLWYEHWSGPFGGDPRDGRRGVTVVEGAKNVGAGLANAKLFLRIAYHMVEGKSIHGNSHRILVCICSIHIYQVNILYSNLSVLFLMDDRGTFPNGRNIWREQRGGQMASTR